MWDLDKWNRVVAIAVIMAMLCPVALGQVDDQALAKIAVLQKKTGVLSDSERQRVDQWLEAQQESLSQAVLKSTGRQYTAGHKRETITKLRDTLVRAAEGSNSYRWVYLTLLSERVLDRLGREDPRVSVNDLLVLSALGDPRLVGAYRQVLGRTDVSSSFIALKGLRAVKEQLSAEERQEVCGQLVKLSQGQLDQTLLAEIYAFVDYPSDLSCRAAVVTLLEWRAGWYTEHQKSANSMATDTELIQIATRAYGLAGAEQKTQILVGLGEILKVTVEADMQAKVSLVTERRRSLLELTIFAVEESLAAITKKNTNLPLIEALGARKVGVARSALVGWLGDSENKGVLNQPPYNLRPMIGSTSSEVEKETPAGS